MNKQISVIGCGWLGFPLAKSFIEKGYSVKGSTTTEGKVVDLKANQIEGYLVSISCDIIKGEIEDCLSNSDLLILNIPPSLRNHTEPNSYVKRIQLLIPFIEKTKIKNVLFISSTSVYNNNEAFPTITESTLLNPKSESGQQLLKVEQLLQDNPNFNTTILRFSGLFGNGRHPAKVLSGKTNLKNPDAPVNLIHLKDCIAIVHSIVELEIWNDTFNVATEPHPSRIDYYTSVCKSLNVSPPEFDLQTSSKGKLIDASKLVQILDYSFKVKL